LIEIKVEIDVSRLWKEKLVGMDSSWVDDHWWTSNMVNLTETIKVSNDHLFLISINLVLQFSIYGIEIGSDPVIVLHYILNVCEDYTISKPTMNIYMFF